MLKNFKELKVWQRSYELCLEIYRITKGFPKEERYGLTSQIRRAAVSVPSNIAEGYGRRTTPEYVQALYVAYGSICELETQVLLSVGLGYIEVEDMKKPQKDIREVERMLKALIRSLENKSSNPRPLESLNPTEGGFTLVELLIAMAVASVVGLAGYVIFSTSNWSYKVQEDVSEAQQNVRVAMDRLAKDIRAAGFGLPDPPFSITIGTSGALTSPITVTTNSSTGPDAITILGIGYEAGTLLKGGSTDCNDSGRGKICLDSVASANSFFTGSGPYTYQPNRRYISLNGTTFIELANTQTDTDRSAGKLALGSPATLDRNYPDGTPVYIIQAIQYTIDTGLGGCSNDLPCLARQDLATDNQVFATGIEDIQFAYGIDANPRDGRVDDTTSNTNPGVATASDGNYTYADFLYDPADDSSIIAVRANIVAKTRNQDQRATGSFRRECLEDRATDASCTSASDGYRRRVLTKVIKLRNPRQGA